MEVLEHGSKYHKRICDSCGATLGYLESELKFEHSAFPMTPEGDKIKAQLKSSDPSAEVIYEQLCFTCPECGCYVFVKETIISKKDYESIYKKQR